MTTAEKILQLIKDKNIEQQALAEYLGIKKQAISDWKSGKTKSYMKYIDKIAKYFEVTVDYLLGSDQPSVVEDVKNSIKNESSPTSTAREALHKKLESMSLDELHEVDQFMDFLLSKEK